MNRLILIFSILLLSALAQSADAQVLEMHRRIQIRNTLHDFASDGCSMSPDGVVVGRLEFVPCCVEHDVAYWAGGTREQKSAADLRLRQCVQEKSNEFMADVYYQAVRVAGGPYLPTPFHWGYGWEKRRGYMPLTEAHQEIVQDKFIQIDWYQIYTSLGIKPVH
jgi:hypothetical protein